MGKYRYGKTIDSKLNSHNKPSRSVVVSNRNHRRLAEKHDDMANDYYGSHSYSPRRSFWTADDWREEKKQFFRFVKRDYHQDCIKQQLKLGRLLSASEKKKLYQEDLELKRDYARKTHQVVY